MIPMPFKPPKPNLGWRALGALLALCWLAGPSTAAEFSIDRTVVKMPEAGELACLLLRTPAGQFRFVPPGGWRMAAQPAEQQVRFLAPDHGAIISLRLLPRPGGSELDSQKAREFVLSEYPRARVLEQFPAHTGCGSGVGFDLHWEQKPGWPLRVRLALIPVGQGCLRFALQANTNSWARQLQPFGVLLTSFAAVGSP